MVRAEVVGIPFAFDGITCASAGRQDEVDLAEGFVAPEADFPVGKLGVKFVEDQVFPKQAKISVSQFRPALLMTDKAGVKSIYLRLAEQLCVCRLHSMDGLCAPHA